MEEINANQPAAAEDQVFDIVAEKQNASERINLQDIMQLRTAFLTADDDGSGELSLREVKNHTIKNLLLLLKFEFNCN